MLGAAHGLEIPFLFGELNFLAATPLVFSEEARPQAEELSRQMMSYWVSFARSGDPGRGVAEDLPRWERWDSERKEGARFMILDSESDGGLRLGAGSLTRSGVLARATVDHRFASVTDMCQLFAGFTRSSVRMSEAEYAEIAGGACRDHPLADASP